MLLIRVMDHKGVLASVASTASKISINIINLNVDVVDDKQVDLWLTVAVTGRKQLASFMRELRYHSKCRKNPEVY